MHLIEDHEGFRVDEYIISCLMKCFDRIYQMFLRVDHNCFRVFTGFFESKSTHSLHEGHNPGQVMICYPTSGQDHPDRLKTIKK